MFAAFVVLCRDFLETHYVDLKKLNPNFPFLVRECSGVEPKIYGRYSKLQLMIIRLITVARLVK